MEKKKLPSRDYLLLSLNDHVFYYNMMPYISNTLLPQLSRTSFLLLYTVMQLNELVKEISHQPLHLHIQMNFDIFSFLSWDRKLQFTIERTLF